MSENIQYVTDRNGERIAVIVPLEEYENLLEDFDLIAAAYEAKGESSRPFSDVIEELGVAGEIDV